jgi:hypothetical protein
LVTFPTNGIIGAGKQLAQSRPGRYGSVLLSMLSVVGIAHAPANPPDDVAVTNAAPYQNSTGKTLPTLPPDESLFDPTVSPKPDEYLPSITPDHKWDVAKLGKPKPIWIDGPTPDDNQVTLFPDPTFGSNPVLSQTPPPPPQTDAPNLGGATDDPLANGPVFDPLSPPDVGSLPPPRGGGGSTNPTAGSPGPSAEVPEPTQLSFVIGALSLLIRSARKPTTGRPA